MEQPPLPAATVDVAHPPATAPQPAPQRRLSVDELSAIALGKGADSMHPFQLYFQLRGRIPRRMFWLHGVLGLLAITAVVNALLDIAGLANDTNGKLVNVLLLWCLIAVSAKRLHDFDRSGWWVLVHFVPGIGSFAVLLVAGIVPGTHGPNRFGADPTEFRKPHALSTAR